MPPAAASALTPEHSLRKSGWLIFAVLFAVGMTWTSYTQHTWEDFYITYRASKNLAVGHGFTFTEGERVHSYTSPLGAILPAVASLLTGNSSDRTALWIFRLMSLTAYAGAGVILWHLARRLYVGVFPAVLLVALFATDAKIIDFTTNGMETAFVLLFLSWTLYALFVSPPRRPVHLGLAWAGLMWSRPDSFIYIGILILGVLLFSSTRPLLQSRWTMVKEFGLAGVITTLLYAPWLIWAWSYYGSPVPHTIIAKGLLKPVASFDGFVTALGDFPLKIARDGAGLGTTFMPPYGGTWDPRATAVSFWLALAVLIMWILPKVRWEARVAALTFAAGHFYLNYFAGVHAPWYVPTLTLLAFLAISTVASQLTEFAQRWSERHTSGIMFRRALVGLSILLPTGALVLTVFAAHQMKIAQTVIEDGNRRLVGEWLKNNASSPRDSVFLEPLGYVGYYSGLKMYDFPGLCSPEVVAARRKLPRTGNYTAPWPGLIQYLLPEWVVLRDSEVHDMNRIAPELLTKIYTLQQIFDVKDKLAAVRFLPGRGYLEFDAHFEIYRRSPEITKDSFPMQVTVRVETLVTNSTWTGPAYLSEGHIAAHAPSQISTEFPITARRLTGKLGFFPGAYEKPQDSTEGADFTITLVRSDGTRHPLFSTRTNPRDQPEHRGDLSFDVDLPPIDERATVEFSTSPIPGKSNAYGWTYWKDLKFELPRI